MGLVENLIPYGKMVCKAGANEFFGWASNPIGEPRIRSQNSPVSIVIRNPESALSKKSSKLSRVSGGGFDDLSEALSIRRRSR
jgi:hypothetical protein